MESSRGDSPVLVRGATAQVLSRGQRFKTGPAPAVLVAVIWSGILAGAIMLHCLLCGSGRYTMPRVPYDLMFGIAGWMALHRYPVAHHA